MRGYELLLVIRSAADDTSAVEVAQTVTERIKGLQGNVTSTNVWGRRRLAYPINKQSEGIYILLKMQALPASLKDLEFDLKLNESILRYLLVKDENPDVVSLQEEASEAEDATPADAPEEASSEAVAAESEAPTDAVDAEDAPSSEAEEKDGQEITEEVA